MKPSIRSKLERITERFEEITALLADPEVQGNQDQYRSLSQEYAQLNPVVDCFGRYQSTEQAISGAREMLEDQEMAELAREEMEQARQLQENLEPQLELLLIPPDPNDQRNVFLEVRAGTGGAEAALFAGDINRMYLRFAELQGWKVETISESQGEQGGYKEIISRVSGNGVYSRLKFESGTHRVQRVPDTESQGRIHTSACTVAILPEADAIDGVEINSGDLRIDTYRASGAGGQHVNRTDSAVRMTHLPTGIVAQCQNDRSQHKNRAQAMAMLKARLYEHELKKREDAAQAEQDAKSDIGWGHQIRSYVLQPYQMVKDLRTQVEKGNAQGVLDGDLDDYLEAALAARIAGGLPAGDAADSEA